MGLFNKGILFRHENDDFNRLQNQTTISGKRPRKQDLSFNSGSAEEERFNQVWRYNNMDRGFYAYKNYLIGIRYGIVPLILPKKYFRYDRLEGLISYPLFIFNSKNIEKEKRKYRKLVRRLFEGLKLNLMSLRCIIEDVIKLGKEAYSLKQLHCYAFEPVKKRCSFSVLLTGMTFEFGFREKRVIQKLSEW